MKTITERHKVMMEVGKYRKDEFNPTIGQTLQNNGNLIKRNFEPFKIKYESQKYHYVVDWQIENEEDSKEKHDINPNGWR
jgi:hypothetical protein